MSSPESYPHLEELKRGLGVVKRVADRVNEMTRKNENRQLKENLRTWVSDWKVKESILKIVFRFGWCRRAPSF